MPDFWLPEQYVKNVMPLSLRRKALTKSLNYSKRILRALLLAGVKEENAEDSLRRVVKFYKDKMKRLKNEGVRAYKSEALNDEKLLNERVDNLLSWNEAERIKEERRGQKYIWLPSSSQEPRPLHQLKYGKTYTVGDGVFPGEEYGCKCGAMFLDDFSKEDINENYEDITQEILEDKEESAKKEEYYVVELFKGGRKKRFSSIEGAENYLRSLKKYGKGARITKEK